MIIQGNSLTELYKLPSETVDCCVTSPPYYQLRDYGCDEQIGLEKTVDEYIEKLVVVFREVRRILKSDGTLWVNIADSYAGSGKGAANYPDNAKKYKQGTNEGMLGCHIPPTRADGCKPKDLLGIPWELAFALRADGWYLRQEIIWHKPNCMPESVKDRCTKAHETIFLFSKSKHYYFDWEAIQEPCVGFDKSSPRGSKGTFQPNAGRRKSNDKQKVTHGNIDNERGLRRKRSVWTVATNGGAVNHYATFPQRLIEPCILAGSREGGIVLDPFAGSGTTGAVAKAYGRDYILIEISKKYAAICHRLEE